uniref:mS31 n=1 Tax=Polytomella magna TaxID=353565 RepID=UPI002240E382|nr:Chain Bx, mS31 [Polytomella magna]8APN_Bx Chain Bx, mS31 [Polytomella magna]8APO_Bx Chain Bx, mS31 [Polytomella magna]
SSAARWRAAIAQRLGVEAAAAAQALAALLGQGDLALTVLAAASEADVLNITELLENNSVDEAVTNARKVAIVSGHGLFLATATSEDLAALSDVEAGELAALMGKVHVVGLPLADALLGSDSLTHDQLLTLTRSEKQALLWRLASVGKLREGRAKAVAALRKAALDRAAAAAEASEGLLSAAAMMKLEHDIAEFDLVRERYLPGPGLPEGVQEAFAPSGLPSAFSRDEQALYDAYFGLRSHAASAQPEPLEGPSAAQLHSSFLDGFQCREEDSQMEELPESFGQWVANIKGLIVKAPVPLLGLLAKFVTAKIDGADARDASETQSRLRLLAAEIATDIARRREARLAVSPWWQRASAPIDALAISSIDHPSSDPLVQLLEVLLGHSGADEFGSWISAVAMRPVSPYEILADEHRLMDLERYLSMTSASELHLELAATPLPWASPAVHVPPAAFLEEMRAKFNNYLLATGLSPLSAAEWSAYKDWALEEFAEKRALGEEALLQEGHSGFFNPKADEIYLRALLEATIPPEAPLREQAVRYLETVNMNKTWTFLKKKHMVQRLAELSRHLTEHPPVEEQGSPFAALFAVGPGAKPTPLVPKLSKRLPAHGPESLDLPELPEIFR